MPFISNEELTEILRENDHLTEKVEYYEGMTAIIGLATVLRDEIITYMEAYPAASPSEIGDLAYTSVLEKHKEEARGEVVARYEQEHREKLYARLVEQVEKEDGKDILKEVKVRVETDPELALELRNSAREELAARAIDVVRSEITLEQQEIINAEANRQIELDRLDVELAVDGELDLHRDDIIDLIQVGDRVELLFQNCEGKKRRFTVEWTIDVKSKQGWQFVSCDEMLYGSSGSAITPDTDRFINIGSIQSDMDSGKSIYVPNVLKKGCLIGLSRHTDGKERLLNLKIDSGIRRYGYAEDPIDMVLMGTDFQTKALHFDS